MTTNRTEYMKQYAKENLKRVPLDLKHDDYELVKKAAAAANESVNGYIKKAVQMRIDAETESKSKNND